MIPNFSSPGVYIESSPRNTSDLQGEEERQKTVALSRDLLLRGGMQELKNAICNKTFNVKSIALIVDSHIPSATKLQIINRLIRCFNDITDATRVSMIMDFLNHAPLNLKYTLGTKSDLIHVNADELEEIFTSVSFKKPFSLIEYLHLTPKMLLNAFHRALQVSPGTFPLYLKQNDMRIEGEQFQLAFAKLLVHYQDFFNHLYNLLELIAYQDQLSEKSLQNIAEEILKAESSQGFESFLTDVVENHKFFGSQAFFLHLLKYLTEQRCELIPSLVTSILFKLHLNNVSENSTADYFSQINKLLDDGDKISTIKALLNKPKISPASDVFQVCQFSRLVLALISRFTYVEKEHLKEALQLVYQIMPLELIKYIKKFNVLYEDIKLEIALKAAKDFPILLCCELDNFEFKDPDSLKQMGVVIYRRDQLLGLSYAQKFHISSQEEYEKNELSFLMTQSKDSLEIALQEKYYEIHSAELLELIGRELIKKYIDLSQDYEIHWAARFLEKAAKIHQSIGFYEKSSALRCELAEMPLICTTNQLLNLSELKQKSFILKSPQGLLNFGAAFQFMGSNSLKGACFHIRDILFDHHPYREISFKLSYWAANQVKDNLNALTKAPPPFSLKFTISREPYLYYAGEGNAYTSDPCKAIHAGTALTVDLEGLAKIQIGDSKEWASMLNAVRIWMAPNASAKDIQKVVSIMGLAEIVTQATSGDVERIISNTLVRFIAPAFAASYDHTATYHEEPLSKLTHKLPSKQSRIKLQKYLKQIKTHTVCGDKRMALRYLTDKAELWKGAGFYTQCKGDITDVAARLASLFSTGFISTQKRFEMGLTHLKGDSPHKDLQCNSADGIFFRLLTANALNKNIGIGNIKANIQIYAKLKAIQLMPYFYTEDRYGTRLRSEVYKNRPDFKSFFTLQQNNLHNHNNEVIFKHRLPPKYLCAITYQDPRKVIVEAIESLGRIQMFDPGMTMQDKAEKVSQLYFSPNPEDKKQLIESLKCHLLDTDDETYQIHKNYPQSLATHWMIDPRPAIESALKSAGINPGDIPVIETEVFLPEVLTACHQPLHINVRKLALRPHSCTQASCHIRNDYHDLIKAIRTHLKTFPPQKLMELLSPDILKRIAKLKAFCQQHLKDISYSGQDSLNRELLTHHQDGGLHDASLITALYALEQLQCREPISKPKYLQYQDLTFTAQIGPGKTAERKITDCLYYGLKDNSTIILERLPNNQALGKVLSFNPKHGKIKYLREYIRRTKIHETFLPIYKAIEKAYESIMESPLPAHQPNNSLFEQPYDIAKWKDTYPALFMQLFEKIQSLDEHTLLKLQASHHTPQKLKQQVLEGFSQLMKYEDKQPHLMSLEEIISYIAECDFLLDQKISHLFCDRLHLLAALKADDSYSITTQSGNVPIREMIKTLIISFSQGVTEANAIAAEQFYLRLLQIHDSIERCTCNE